LIFFFFFLIFFYGTGNGSTQKKKERKGSVSHFHFHANNKPFSFLKSNLPKKTDNNGSFTSSSLFLKFEHTLNSALCFFLSAFLTHREKRENLYKKMKREIYKFIWLNG
jgi:hypothetical protein